MWSRNGRELFYFHGASQFAFVNIALRPVFTAGIPVELWRQGSLRAMMHGRDNHRGFDPTADGRFLSLVRATPDADRAASQVHVVLNWFEHLQPRLSAPR